MSDIIPQNRQYRPRGRPFAKGQSGNPAGRRRGCRNKATRAAEAYLDGEAETLARKAVELALAGNPLAMRLCLERTVAPRRERPEPVALPSLRNTADLAPAMAKADEAYLACLDTRSIDDWQTPRYRPPPRVEEPIKSAIERLMTRYRTDLTDIDLATHSPFELFAWCLSRHGATYDEAADKARKAAEDLLLLIDELPNDPTLGDAARGDLIEEHQ